MKFYAYALCAMLLLSGCSASNKPVRSYFDLMLFERYLTDADEAKRIKQPEQAARWYKLAITEASLADSSGLYKTIAQVSAAQNSVVFNDKAAAENLSLAIKSLYQCLDKAELHVVSQTIRRTLIHVIRLDVEVALKNGNIARVDRRVSELAELLREHPDMLKIPETKFELHHMHRLLAAARRTLTLGMVQELEKALPAKERETLEVTERVQALSLFHDAENFKRDNQPGAAIDQLNRALSLAIDLNDVSLQLSIYVEMARLEALRGKANQVKKNLDHAIQLAHELKDDHTLLKVITVSLRIQQQMGGDVLALYRERAEEIKKVVGDSLHYADFLREAGVYSLKIDKVDDAFKFAEQAAEIYSRKVQKSSSGQKALNEILLARIAQRRNQEDKMNFYFAEARKLERDCTDRKLKEQIKRELSQE